PQTELLPDLEAARAAADGVAQAVCLHAAEVRVPRQRPQVEVGEHDHAPATRLLDPRDLVGQRVAVSAVEVDEAIDPGLVQGVEHLARGPPPPPAGERGVQMHVRVDRGETRPPRRQLRRAEPGAQDRERRQAPQDDVDAEGGHRSTLPRKARQERRRVWCCAGSRLATLHERERGPRARPPEPCRREDHPVPPLASPPPPLLILGSHIAALGVLRVVARRGIPCQVLDETSDIIVRSRWYRPAAALLRETSDPAVLGEHLLRLPHERAVLIACSDVWTTAVAGLPEAVRERFPASVPTADAVARFVDKERFGELVEHLAIPRPRTTVVRSAAD